MKRIKILRNNRLGSQLKFAINNHLKGECNCNVEYGHCLGVHYIDGVITKEEFYRQLG